MADTSTGEYTPKETPKVLKTAKKKKKKTVRAGSYKKKARKGYEDMLAEAGKI